MTKTATPKIAAGLVLCLAAAPFPLAAQDIKEPTSGVSFPARDGELSLLGLGLRTKSFLKVKVYAIGLYVADSALSGVLAPHKGKLGSPGFYADVASGDFNKEVRLRFVRDLSAGQIQEAMREALGGAERARVDAFVGYFPAIQSGQEAVIRWAQGGVLETVMAGQLKPPIEDKAFAAAVFGIWLGPKPIQEDLKRGLVSRAPELLN